MFYYRNICFSMSKFEFLFDGMWICGLVQVKYCSENGKRLIHFSTCEVYGKTIGSFLPKDSPLRQVKFHFPFSFHVCLTFV